MFIYIDFLIKKILKRKQNVIMVFICFFVIVFIYVMNINSQKILRDSLASQIKMSEKAINDKTKIMESNDVDDSSIQSLQKEIDEINTTKKRYDDLIEYYENKQWDKFYDSYLNELNSQKKVIQQTQEISEKDTKKDTNKNEYLEMIEATDKQMNIINHYRKNHLNYENTDYPIYGITFTLYLFRTVFPILLTAVSVYLLSQVFTFDYVENMDRSKLLSLKPIEKTVSKIIAGCIIVLGIFTICTLISVLIATFVTKNIGNDYPIMVLVDNHLTCIKAITVFVKVMCMNIFYMIFIILLSYIMSLLIRDSLTLLLILLCMTIGCAYLPNILPVIKPFSHLFPFIYVNALLVIDGSLTKTFMNPNMYFNFGMMVLITGMIVLIVLIIVLLALETKNDKEKLCQ
ncbi:hypothetical protein KSW27_11975 [Holdemanella biformis]|jgi:hypothetical protein|uniref:hypothetical protein n=2 Tax=Holdemanella biformis TaxID=1735 RepID=UPI001C2582E8|nr:hypothetical protein [Holdemanella biformis]MBU9896873.1 hypothetical protein [Holdemanella biformis]MBV3417982.1 hypothetical protein [Holdemanella biformis]